MNAGLNLYSIRNLIETEEAFLDTAKKLKDMGYSYLQYSGGVYDPDRISRVSKATGLPIVLTHVPLDRMKNDLDKLMEEHESFGCKNIGLGSIPIAQLISEDGIIDEKTCKAAIAELDEIGARMEEKGFHFFLHNHHYEFMRMSNGERIFDYIVANAPHINFTLDVYWLQYAGMDILATAEMLKGRIGCVHLKDYAVAKVPDGELYDIRPMFESVGYGNIDFKAVVPALKEAGAEYFLVEQDNAALLPDTLHQVERSIRYIVNEL